MARVINENIGRRISWTCPCKPDLIQNVILDRKQTIIPVCCASTISRSILSKTRIRQMIKEGELLDCSTTVGNDKRTFTTIESILDIHDKILLEAQSRQQRMREILEDVRQQAHGKGV